MEKKDIYNCKNIEDFRLKLLSLSSEDLFAYSIEIDQLIFITMTHFLETRVKLVWIF